MIVGHVYTSCFIIQYLEYENQLFQLLGSEILFFELPKVSSLCLKIFAISFMGTLILVLVDIIVIVALPCLFGEAKPCQVGLVLGQGTPFGILIYFDFKFIFQKKRVSLFKHAYRVTFIRFRVRRNCKRLSLVIFVCLLQVARGSGELELTYSPAFYIIWLVYSLQCSWPTYRVQYRHSWFKEG